MGNLFIIENNCAIMILHFLEPFLIGPLREESLKININSEDIDLSVHKISVYIQDKVGEVILIPCFETLDQIESGPHLQPRQAVPLISDVRNMFAPSFMACENMGPIEEFSGSPSKVWNKFAFVAQISHLCYGL